MEDRGVWVLVGIAPTGVKVIGPFDSAHEADGAAAGLGIPEVSWRVTPLIRA